MTKLTRRAALSLGAGSAALAACAPTQGALSEAPAGSAFNHGVASGDPGQTDLVIWTRITVPDGSPARVRWQVAEDDSFARIVREGVFATSAARDHTVKVLVDGLRPGRTYAYRFDAGGVQSPVGRTRTAPASGKAATKIAFVSCSNFPAGYFNAYRAIAMRDDVDLVVHLGDYFYEYGPGGYATEFGAQVGRVPVPAKETVTLEDYRLRYAQYRSDPDLQAAHAAAPWITTWDDHESTNNSYRDGAENHDASEGPWSVRKAAAVQAYLEWLPVRDPDPSRPRESIYRAFDWGDLATFIALESRLTGRSKQLDWAEALAGVTPETAPAKVRETLMAAAAPDRSMLGPEQERWLDERLKASVGTGKTWQVLLNQIILAKVVAPNLYEAIPQTERDQLMADNPFVARYLPFTQLGVPMNLDAWDGYPTARARLYASAKAAGASLIAVTGDTHTAWCNQLVDDGTRIGAEFGCTSITSPGLGDVLPIPTLGDLMAEANEEVLWYSPFQRGFGLLTLSDEAALAEFFTVSTIYDRTFEVSLDAAFRTTPADTGVGAIEKVA